MTAPQTQKNPSTGFPKIELLNGAEIAKILQAILKETDVPRTKRQPAAKTILLDFFGMANTGKTTVTAEVERVFRRQKMNVFCPPETAEWPNIRSKSTGSPVVFQARHLVGVEDQVVNLAEHRDYHAAIMSRGLIDMVYWYEKGVRDGLYTSLHQRSINEMIFELLRQDLVDAFVFFTCTPEIALEREYGKALTKERGSNMNEKTLSEAREIYDIVLEEVGKEVPNLPIFHIDTTNLNIQEVVQKILSFLLPTICVRFKVSESRFLPYLPSLVRKKTEVSEVFEEQLKLRGHPDSEIIQKMGWKLISTNEENDTYLNPIPNQLEQDGYFDEISRIRETNGEFKFLYKGPGKDRLLSHRKPLNVLLTKEEADEILKTYSIAARTKKQRQRFRLEGNVTDGNGHFFSLHVDTVEGMGDFTEIRARGSSNTTHTQELFRLAAQLGFELDDVVEGSYLALALALS